MKCFLTAIVLVCIQFFGLAQNNSKSIDEVAVAARVETLRLAMIDASKTKLLELTSKALSYGHSNGLVQNQSEFVEKIINGESDFVTIAFQNQTIEILGKSAIVRHNLEAHTRDGGVEKDIKIGIMLVWQKHKKNWLLIARQAFKLPT